MDISPLQKLRYEYEPKKPSILEADVAKIGFSEGQTTEAASDTKALREIFPNTYGKPIVTLTGGTSPSLTRTLTVGVILSGGQAPGGHNVIAGLFDGLMKGSKESKLIGFKGGPGGLVDNTFVILSKNIIDEYRNTGGFDIIGSGRTKIETAEQFAKAASNAKAHKLDAIVVIGGDDSNTNAALLAEYFAKENMSCSVIGVPKTIDGDLKNEHIETSFGFDTATKTYSELIGNIERDAASARKYWHFIKLMGRSASHITLECALSCRPNIALISEEVEKKQQTLSDITESICAAICVRAAQKENFGVILIPEGLIEFIPEFRILIDSLNDLLAHHKDQFGALDTADDKINFVSDKLEKNLATLYTSLPHDIKLQLIMDRDPHGNVQVSRIETEKLLVAMVEKRLTELKSQGSYVGSFSYQTHFFGYEGRCAFPSNFDADYCYSLGMTAWALAAGGYSGYLSSVRNLTKPAHEWVAGGIPLTMMMNIEKRHGTEKPVIKKALVTLDSKPFKAFAALRETWAIRTSYHFPGAIQYFGPTEVCDKPTETILLEHR